MQPQPQAVMAGIGDVVPALFIIIALISGFLNFLKEKKNTAEAEDLRQRKRERKQNQPDDELSAFLDEVGASETTSAPQQRRRKRPSQRDRARHRRQQREEARAETERPRRRPGKSGVAERHLETSELGTVSSRHVESSVESRHLESQVADQHLFDVEKENAGATTAATTESSSESHPLLGLLGKPEGMRNAILLNEILQRPSSLRK